MGDTTTVTVAQQAAGRTISTIVPATGCVVQPWTVRNRDGSGEYLTAHRPVMGLAHLADGSLDLVIELHGGIALRRDAEAWAVESGLAPDSYGPGKPTQWRPDCTCHGAGGSSEHVTRQQVEDAYADA